MGPRDEHAAPRSAGARRVLERVRRFASLCAAKRALSPSVCAHDRLPAPDWTQRIRDRLASLPEQLASSGNREATVLQVQLSSLDRELEAYADRLRSVVDDIPMPGFRATLPELALTHPGEVVALLDLCAEKSDELSRRFDLFDYLVTVVSSRRRDERWQLICDPCAVSARLRALSGRAAATSDEQRARLVRRLHAASSELEDLTHVGPLVKRVKSIKLDGLRYMRAPDVLNALVSYNVAVRNRIEASVDTERREDVVEEVREALGHAPAPD